MAAKMLACAFALWTTLISTGDEPKSKPVADEVFVLGKDLIQLIEKDPDAVILVGEQARKYIESVRDRDRAGAPSTVIQQCQIRGEILENHARLKFEVTTRSLREERSPIPLGLGDAQLISASIDSGSPFFTRDKQGWIAWVEGAGQHVVAIEVQVPLTGSVKLPELSCAIPEAPVTNLELKTTKPVADVSLIPKVPVTLRSVGDPKPQIESTLGPRSKLDLRLRWADEQSRGVAPLMQASSQVIATVESGIIYIRTELQLHVSRGTQPTCELKLSPDERVLDLRSSDGSVAPWQSVTEGGEQRIIIHFPAPLAGRAEFMMTSEVAWTGSSAVLRGITVPGAHSHRSLVAVRAAGDLDVATSQMLNMRRAESLPASMLSPRNEAALAAYAQPFQLSLSIQPRRANSTVRTTAVVACAAETATVLLRWQFTVHGGKISQVDVLMPPGFSGNDIVFTDIVQSVREDETAKGRVSHVFLKGSPEEFELRLRATIPLIAARNLAKIDLPLPQGTRSELSRFFLAGAPDTTLEPTPDLEPTDDLLDPSWIRDLPEPAPSLSGFRTRSLLDRVAFRFSKIVPTVLHQTRIHITLDGEAVVVRQAFVFSSRGPKLRRLRLAVPDSVSESLRLDSGPGQLAASTADGEMLVELERDLSDPIQIQVSYRLPLISQENSAAAQTVLVPLVRAIDGRCELTRAGVTAPTNMTVRVQGDEWRATSTSDRLPGPATDNPRVLVSKPDSAVSLALDLTTATSIARADIVVDRGLIETRLGSAGEWRTRARCVISEVSAAKLLVQVPSTGRITRIQWQGKPIAARADSARGVVEIAVPPRPEVPAILEIEAEGVTTTQNAYWKTHIWEAPILQGKVQWGQTFWQLTIPESLAVLRGPSDYTDENRVHWRALPLGISPRQDSTSLENWLTGSGTAVSEVPSGHRLLYGRLLSVDPIAVTCVNRPVLVLISSGFVLCLGLAIVTTSQRNRSWISFVAMLAISTFAILEPTAAIACFQSAGLGVVLVTIAGVSHALILRRRTKRLTVFPEPGMLAKSQGSSGKSTADFVLGQATPDANRGSLMPTTSVTRLAPRSSSVR